MAYTRLQLDPHTPKRVKDLLAHVDMSFSDVHAMMRLPIHNYGIGAGCNFAITHVLMSVIGGVSTTLYKQSGHVGTRFKEVLEGHYPWDLEPAGILPKVLGAEAIYNVFRNPLTHDLGLDVKLKSRGVVVKVKRLKTKTPGGNDRGLPEKFIESLENATIRPNMSAAVSATPQKTVLLVEGLYWGVRVMIERLTADRVRMAAADNFLAQF